jgi:diketogulonate reductase-like aldo/keto reductase
MIKVLDSGFKIPIVGLGTSRMDDLMVETIVRDAIEIGYGHIDTAHMYNNSIGIGKILKNIPREKYILTFKVMIHDLEKFNSDEVSKQIDGALKDLNLEYIDICLLHWPHEDASLNKKCIESLLDAKSSGKIKVVGVSNFSDLQINALSDVISYVEVNQLRCHIGHLVESILPIIAYSPLAGCYDKNWSGSGMETIIQSDTLQNISKKYNKSVVQLALKVLVEKKIPFVVRSKNILHLKDNLDIFDWNLESVDLEICLNYNFQI